MALSILWYDLETFGLDSRHDRIAQFAGIRTDSNLEPISDKLVLYNKITPDYLPSPYSCLVHKISPQETLKRGISEYEFAKAIRAEMMKPGTCVSGYNSIKFDDEFIRNLFYRNLFDPYEREWCNGNTRWDVIDLFRATRDLRPEGLSWPDNEEGKPDFRLTSLAEANNIPLESAHDAFFDIHATIALAKLIKQKQAKLFSWYFKTRTKDALRPLINLVDKTPLVYTNAVFTRRNGCSTVIAPVGMIPGHRDNLLAIDLRYDPSPLLDYSVEEIQEKLFSKKTENEEKIPLIDIKIGRCPFLAPMSTMDRNAADRLKIDLELIEKRTKLLAKDSTLIQKLLAVFAPKNKPAIDIDPEYRIYTGGFFRDEDKDAMASVHEAIATLGPKEARPHCYNLPFVDERLPQLVRRLFARNWPKTLKKSELTRWRSFCAGRLLLPRIDKATSNEEYLKIVNTQLSSLDTPAENKVILFELLEYHKMLEKEILSYDEKGKTNDE